MKEFQSGRKSDIRPVHGKAIVKGRGYADELTYFYQNFHGVMIKVFVKYHLDITGFKLLVKILQVTTVVPNLQRS